jgi:hypothetical protein
MRTGWLAALGLAISGFSILPAVAAGGEWRAHLDTEGLPPHLRDRGVGVPSSMFATYIQKGQFLVYPYLEYYRDANYEYKPAELGDAEERDYRGEFEAFEELIFLGYGVSHDLALELEAAVAQAELESSPEDASEFPDRLEESGVGDIEAQVRWRWAAETARRPEFFSYFETVFPTQDEGSLIGTSDWEFVLGAGFVRGFPVGTVGLRLAAEYDKAESALEVGEAALEYTRRVSSRLRAYGAVEGTQDEWELITEAQVHLHRNVFIKLNNAFGLTSKAPDWAPEVGVLFSF